MLSNIQHWTDFYSKPATPLFPSQFAVFVHSWLMGKKQKVVEIGCGNGRDSQFFHSNGHEIVATDQVICENLQAYASQQAGFSVAEGDVVQCVESILEKGEEALIYSRFFQHAIPSETEDSLLENLSNLLGTGSMMFFEFRLSSDENRPKVFGVEHYRRFQSSEQFAEKLQKHGFSCEYQVEGEGYARYGDEDPYVGRFVAIKEPTKKFRVV